VAEDEDGSTPLPPSTKYGIERPGGVRTRDSGARGSLYVASSRTEGILKGGYEQVSEIVDNKPESLEHTSGFSNYPIYMRPIGGGC